MKHSSMIGRALSLLALGATAWAVASGVQAQTAAQPQPQMQAPSNGDAQTQTAVADYNAGNMSAALKEFREAADHGDRLAQFNYAMMLLNGEGTTADVDEGR